MENESSYKNLENILFEEINKIKTKFKENVEKNKSKEIPFNPSEKDFTNLEELAFDIAKTSFYNDKIEFKKVLDPYLNLKMYLGNPSKQLFSKMCQLLDKSVIKYRKLLSNSTKTHIVKKKERDLRFFHHYLKLTKEDFMSWGKYLARIEYFNKFSSKKSNSYGNLEIYLGQPSQSVFKKIKQDLEPYFNKQKDLFNRSYDEHISKKTAKNKKSFQNDLFQSLFDSFIGS